VVAWLARERNGARQSITRLGWDEKPLTEPNKEHPTGHPTRSERETATGRLLIAYRDEGDGRARDRLAQLYLPLVEGFASRCGGRGAEYEDLVQVGSTALLGAIDRCDPKRGDEFLAFAIPSIADDIRRHLREVAQTVHLPDDPAEHGRAAPPGDSGDVELDERILLADVFHTLDHAERAIIYLRLVCEMGGQETAAQLGMSEDRLRRSTRAALAKLRGELERSAFPGTRRARARTGNGPAAEAGTSDTRPSAASANGGDGNGRSASPSTKAEYSGRILVRMPQTLHDELARAAESERVSLNQFITNALAAAIGWQLPPHSQERAPRWLPAAVVTNIVVVVLAGIAAMILLLVALDQGL
jgi:RNA polymerase sigma factor (sigma-70 family)